MNPVASLFINGNWIAGEGTAMESLNPGNGDQIWKGRAATDSQVDDAVQAAINAFPAWSGHTFEQRVAHVRRFNEVVEHYRTLIADTIGQETGKPFWEAETEVAALQGKAEISIQAYLDRTPSHEDSQAGLTTRLQHRPHGVVAIFGPYNFPAHLPNGHIMPALLAGNTIVLKPSELTPRTAELLVHLWQKAELPDGVLNLVQGDRETGAALASHPQIDGLYFTGSATTGCYLHEQFAGQTEKILALEMGGNNPLLVTEVKDIQAAVFHTIQSAYITSGQRCTCARRLIVPEDHAGDRFIDALRKAVGRIQVGAYNLQPAPFMGAMISNTAVDNVMAMEQALIERGAEPLVALHRPDPQYAYLTPGLIDVTGVTDREDKECFGPLLQVIRVADLDAAILEANNTRFGLSAGVLSDNPQVFHQFDRTVRAGLINWNRPLTGASSKLPFGGTGISGNHRASAWYAADYCAYPVASQLSERLVLPEAQPPGLTPPAESD